MKLRHNGERNQTSECESPRQAKIPHQKLQNAKKTSKEILPRRRGKPNI